MSSGEGDVVGSEYSRAGECRPQRPPQHAASALRNTVWFVDWAHAHVGAPWVDLLFFAPSVEMEGGPRPEQLLGDHPLLRGVQSADIDAVVAAIAGFFTWQGVQPPPPGLPTVRAFQAAQGAIARQWLARRLGLPAPA